MKGSYMQYTNHKIEEYLEKAIEGIKGYLQSNKSDIREEIFNSANLNVPQKLEHWLKDESINHLSPNAKAGIIHAIKDERWANIVDAFIDEIAFGTGGIRGVAAFATRENEIELERLFSEGIDAPILKGPNTINDLVLMSKSTGVAKYANENNLKSIVIGYDSRIQGRKFAELITKIFLKYGMKVYLFDEACPYPELTFAIPHLGADMGILISASHNDRRYNGYKLSSCTGAQFEKSERDKIFFQYIIHVDFKDIKILPEIPINEDRLTFLGGEGPQPGVEYFGNENSIINMHKVHRDHINEFILDPDLLKTWGPKIYLGFSAYHGAGRIAVPELLKHFHLNNLQVISKLNELDGRFPCFALEQQPDPGDNVAAEVAVHEFKMEYGENEFEKLDLLIGTDPDADRAGFIVKVPEKQIPCYKKINQKPDALQKALGIAIPNYICRKDFNWHLLDADNAWTLLLWYRLMKEAELNDGVIKDANKKFLSLSHTTSDSMVRLMQKYGLGVIKTWVGFAYLANSVYMVWNGKNVKRELDDWSNLENIIGTGDPELDIGKKIFKNQNHQVLFDTYDMDFNKTEDARTYNFATLEQSNGFSILGPKPTGNKIWGKGGHVRDKDGTFAAILITEVQAYAKSQGKTLIELLDEHIYLDPDIGLFTGYYEPEPYWGQFEGPTGMSKKINILKKVEEFKQDVIENKEIKFGSLTAKRVESYRTGKYDVLHRWKQDPDLEYFNGFPDEGIRFFFSDDNDWDHLTIRPSGTSNCLRFHVQLKAKDLTETNLCHKKEESVQIAKNIVADVRKMVGL